MSRKRIIGLEFEDVLTHQDSRTTLESIDVTSKAERHSCLPAASTKKYV